MPNQDQTMSLVRALLMFVGNMLVAKGVLSSADAPVVETAIITGLGAAVTAGPIVWGVIAHTHTAMIQAVNAANNGAKVVLDTTPAPVVNVAPK